MKNQYEFYQLYIVPK